MWALFFGRCMRGVGVGTGCVSCADLELGQFREGLEMAGGALRQLRLFH